MPSGTDDNDLSSPVPLLDVSAPANATSELPGLKEKMRDLLASATGPRSRPSPASPGSNALDERVARLEEELFELRTRDEVRQEASLSALAEQVERNLSNELQQAMRAHSEKMELSVQALMQRVDEMLAKGGVELCETAMDSLLRRADETLLRGVSLFAQEREYQLNTSSTGVTTADSRDGRTMIKSHATPVHVNAQPKQTHASHPMATPRMAATATQPARYEPVPVSHQPAPASPPIGGRDLPSGGSPFLGARVLSPPRHRSSPSPSTVIGNAVAKVLAGSESQGGTSNVQAGAQIAGAAPAGMAYPFAAPQAAYRGRSMSPRDLQVQVQQQHTFLQHQRQSNLSPAPGSPSPPRVGAPWQQMGAVQSAYRGGAAPPPLVQSGGTVSPRPSLSQRAKHAAQTQVMGGCAPPGGCMGGWLSAASGGGCGAPVSARGMPGSASTPMLR